jgi:hypothetical protein
MGKWMFISTLNFGTLMNMAVSFTVGKRLDARWKEGWVSSRPSLM